MKILVLAPHPFFQERGTPIATKAFVEVLAQRGDEVDLLCYHEGDDVQIPRCTVHRISMWSSVRNLRPGFSIKKLLCDVVMYRVARKMMRETSYDLVHAVEEAGFLAVALKKQFGVPYVYDMDSSLPDQMQNTFAFLRVVRPLMDRIAGGVVRQSTGVVAVCKALEDEARQYAPNKEIARIEDVSLIDIDGDITEHLSATIGSDGPIVMYVGNLEPYQGIDLLIESFAYAARNNRDAQLVIIGGSDNDITHYRQKVSSLGIGDRAHLIGSRPLAKLGMYLAQSTIVTSPRITGGNTPMKVYSYLDSGRCLLATDLETHTQVLDNDIAMLAPPEPEKMGVAMTKLLQDADLRERLATNARTRAQAEYSAEAFNRKVVDFYDRVEAEIGTGSNAPPPPSATTAAGEASG